MKPKAHHIPYFRRNLWKQGLQLENAMPGCFTEIAVLDVFVDHYYYYCFKRKREALVRRLICTNSNQSGVEDGVTSEDARLSHSNIWFHMAVLHEKDFHLGNKAKWPPSPTPAFILLMSPQSAPSVCYSSVTLPHTVLWSIFEHTIIMALKVISLFGCYIQT